MSVQAAAVVGAAADDDDDNDDVFDVVLMPTGVGDIT